MLHRFRGVSAQGVWGGISVAKLAAIPFGLAYALFPCLPQGSIYLLLDGAHTGFLLIALLAVLATCSWLLLLSLQMRASWTRVTEFDCALFLSVVVGGVATATALMIWLPTYDKLWLQPLAFLFLASTIVLNEVDASEKPWRAKAIRNLGIVLIVVLVTSNTVTAINERSTEAQD